MQPARRGAPVALQDSCEAAALEDLVFDLSAISDLKGEIEDGEFPNTHAVLIEHAGCLVYEEYFQGEDRRWGVPLGTRIFGKNSLHDLRSISKSVTSALLGIAFEVDYAEALDTPVIAFFEDLDIEFGPGVDRVTLRHILTMTAGIEWDQFTNNDRENDWLKHFAASKPIVGLLSRPVTKPPGSTWVYSDGLTQVLAGIVERKTGKAFLEFAEVRFSNPSGLLATNGSAPLSGVRRAQRVPERV